MVHSRDWVQLEMNKWLCMIIIIMLPMQYQAQYDVELFLSHTNVLYLVFNRPWLEQLFKCGSIASALYFVVRSRLVQKFRTLMFYVYILNAYTKHTKISIIPSILL